MSKIIRVVSPVDGSVCVERNIASEDEISQSLERAKVAQYMWGQVSLEERQAICRNAIQLLGEESDEVAREIACQMGRPIKFSIGEVAGFSERACSMIELSSRALRTEMLAPKKGFVRYIQRNPVGVVLVIAPWNYPYLTSVNAFLPALLAGNSVILKHSPQTLLCAERLVRVFEEAGLPAGVFQFLHMDHGGSEFAIKSPITRYVAFTGSVAGGAAIERAAAGRFIGVGLELGGKDSAYVREDADVSFAVENLVDGAFFNSGQSCCSIERIYVHHSIFEVFIEKAVELTNKYILNSPLSRDATLGPMVSAKAANFVREQIRDAIEQGAKPHIDESAFPMSKLGTAYLAPQILTNVRHDMRIMTEETFGPVVCVMSVASDQEAIDLMNDSDFGLTAAVFTNDIDVAVRLGEALEVGTFFVNRCDYLDPELAWTGVKNSGHGCTLSVLGFASFTQLKSFNVKLP